jgi:hypothetical protein
MANAALGSTRKIEVVGHRSHEEILYSQLETSYNRGVKDGDVELRSTRFMIYSRSALRFPVSPMAS